MNKSRDENARVNRKNESARWDVIDNYLQVAEVNLGWVIEHQVTDYARERSIGEAYRAIVRARKAML